MDLGRGELSFSKPGQEPTHQFPAQFIGLLAQEHSFWQWGWVAEEKGSMNPLVLQSAHEIREFGQRQLIPELTYPEIASGSVMIAPGLTGITWPRLRVTYVRPTSPWRRRTPTRPD